MDEQHERIELTESDLIEALLQAQVGLDGLVDGALTVQEIAKQSGLREEMVRARLRELNRAGRLEVGRVRRLRMDGQSYPAPAYRLRRNGATDNA